ncbi:pre-rRNA-processing protein ESF1 [Coprinopsis cinerea okayama7|uniref:Pre-rRNA-processing protein ESF1 n=1 Tax=Coprinopsis cinerea (strain Okayama-7 / 130 / ATCC MYA-4618 / FGSC 9003) TaxID=240176 RepID=A8N1C5_COPC7|nr:pre-rRNA-processing protein ESF1 [Coprinopsis cinerea okayama7\|eukprot:XP_001828674.1 pre-rRNA-processing protein ESF1 [Coprinopsis cinerea okayama7\
MSDPRFKRLKTDPRFRPIKKKQNKVVVDERFKSILDQGKKKDKVKGRVDKYGRTLSSTHEEDNLKRFYRLENEDEDEPPARPDYARGGVLMESSDEEDDEPDVRAGDDSDNDEGFVTLGGDDINEPEIDLDEDTIADLDAQAKAYAEANPEQDDDDEDEVPRTRRIAAVNLDWDHVRAAHLYKICASLVSPTAPLAKPKQASNSQRDPKKASQVNVARGQVLSVVVYPSDFGKERMAREEKEGPPPEIFKKQKNEQEITEKSLFEVGGEDEVDETALRKYQLERLRYYYAIITCDTVEAASHIYDELQGTELERSANVFDLSFVPDDMTFENEPRDEATEEQAATVKPLEFVTDALRHSKVKLTWDEDDPERNQVTRRALSKQEIEEGDFRAYIASSSESESEGEPSSSKKSKKKDREKLRSLLLSGNNDAMPEGWGDDGGSDVDMEITFTPGLTGKADNGDETTLERYQRKMREKRKKRKEELKEKASSGKGKESAITDDFFEADSDSDSDAAANRSKGSKGKKVQSEEPEDEGKREATAEELALLVASDKPGAEPQHFDFKAVVKAEKTKSKKKRKHQKGKDDKNDELQEDFVMDVQDDRFKALHEDHQFAIDPSNPHFKKTKGMSALLEERRKRLHKQSNEPSKRSASESNNNEDKSLEKLVESVKRKTLDAHTHGKGKRRKL